MNIETLPFLDSIVPIEAEQRLENRRLIIRGIEIFINFIIVIIVELI